jgi:hypothetical protein
MVQELYELMSSCMCVYVCRESALWFVKKKRGEKERLIERVVRGRGYRGQQEEGCECWVLEEATTG